jgi:hypothetical protein
MLKILRNRKTAKKIWIGLALIIIPAFMFWGSASVMRNKDEGASLGKGLGKNISELEFKDALAAVRTQAIMQFGDKFDEVQKYLDLRPQAIERVLLLHEAN